MRRAGLLVALPLLAACIPPEGVTAEDLAAFDAAVVSVGCDLRTERQYLPVELQTGLPRAVLIEIAQYRVSRREAVPLEGGGIRLVTGACTPEEPAGVTA
jgi:hypothetical protein